MTRTAFFISDGTGITAESLGRSLLAQFENVEIRMITKPYIDSVEKAENLVEVINGTAVHDGEKPIIIDTIVDSNIRQIISDAEGFNIDIFSTFLKPLEQELAAHSSYSVGRTHSMARTRSTWTASIRCTSPWTTTTAPAPTSTTRPT